MKRLALPLVAALPFLTALCPHADAGAITADSSVLTPRLFGPRAFKNARNGSLPSGAIKLPRLASASNEIVPTAGGVITTGAGTIDLGATGFNLGGSGLSGGTLTVNQSSGVVTGNWWINLPRTGGGTLDVGSGNVSVNVQNGTLDFGAGQTLDALTIDSGGTVQLSSLSTPPAPIAAAPVPEPGSAILLAIGSLAVSQARRRRTS